LLVFLPQFDASLAAWATPSLNLTCAHLGVLNEYIRFQGHADEVIGTATGNRRRTGLAVVERHTNVMEILTLDRHRFHAFSNEHSSFNHTAWRNDCCRAAVFQSSLFCQQWVNLDEQSWLQFSQIWQTTTHRT